MKKNQSLLVIACVMIVSALVMAGCNKPEAEMKRAQQAIAEAKAAGAAEYAADELSSAERLLAEGKDLMNKWKYKDARQKFEESYRMALAAKGKVPAVTQTEPGQVDQPPARSDMSHTVVKGECLWRIAEYDRYYDDPFQWPLIYDANRQEINSTANAHGFTKNEENWIFPGQEFDIPQGSSTDEIKAARKRAGAPAPYLPPGQ